MSSKSIPGARVQPAEAVALRERHLRMAGGGPATWDIEVTGFRRVPEQLLGHSGDGFAVRVLQETYLAERATKPWLSPEQFLGAVPESSFLGRVIDELLGPSQARLLRATDRGTFERAVVEHYREFRGSPPPFDAGISYSRHRYLDGDHVDLRESRLLVLPPNAPVFNRLDGTVRYPGYATGRDRANRSVAAVQLGRDLGRDVPLDATGRELFEALHIRHSLETYPCYLDPELRLTVSQSAFTLSTGYSPIYRSVLSTSAGEKVAGLKPCGSARAVAQARWELANRYGPEYLDEATDLRAEWNRLRGADTGTRPAEVVEHDAFSQASTDELFSIALREAHAPRVLLSTPEWEHHRSQRFCARMIALARALEIGEPWESSFRMLTGLCEPENLHFLMPWMHAMEDFYAGGFSPARKNVWATGEFNAAAFVPNSTRVDRWNNLAVVNLTKHPDIARAKDALVAYEPRHLIALLSAMKEDAVLAAARNLHGADRTTWDAIAGQLNTAAEVLGMSRTYRLPSLD